VSIIVQKYGGTSVGNPERIKNVAQRVARFQDQGHQVVVVVSAMSGETNKLIALAKQGRAQLEAQWAEERAQRRERSARAQWHAPDRDDDDDAAPR